MDRPQLSGMERSRADYALIQRKKAGSVDEFIRSLESARQKLSVAEVDERNTEDDHQQTAHFGKREPLTEEQARPEHCPNITKRHHGIKNGELRARLTYSHHVKDAGK